jgi:putative hydrolase
MIDLHTHSLLSDGELIPSELIRRAEASGYRAIAITDHVDGSNVDFVVPRLVEVCRELRGMVGIEIIAGAEITHVPPELIAPLARRCRGLEAELVVVHGETLVEPVKEGTNAAALKAPIDILVHPGLLTLEQAREAASRGIFLEISGRKGHCLGNGNVARKAIASGAKLVVCTDAHSPSDLISVEHAARVARGAGLTEDEVKKAIENAEGLLENIIRKRK